MKISLGMVAAPPPVAAASDASVVWPDNGGVGLCSFVLSVVLALTLILDGPSTIKDRGRGEVGKAPSID